MPATIEKMVSKRRTQQNITSFSPVIEINDDASDKQESKEAPSESPKDIVETKKVNIHYLSPKLKIQSPMPLLAKGKIYADDDDHLAWRRKRLGQTTTVKVNQECIDDLDIINQEQRDQRVQRKKKLKEVQDMLAQFSDQIKVKQVSPIKTELYPQFFKFRIYEAYKPQTLQMARDYLNFLVSEQTDESQFSRDQYNYVTQKEETKLPSYINQKMLLQFDSNFESGNLDSAYLVNTQEYNLLLQVDTNTRGHTHWFYFKVLNWRPETTVKFNILNLARDLSNFYSRGMNIVTRIESANGAFKTEWKVDETLTQVLECARSDVVQSFRKDEPTKPAKFFSNLKFQCRFPQIDQLNKPTQPVEEEQNLSSMGTVFCFAYALPYVFSDLMADLQSAQKFLLKSGGTIKREVPPEFQVEMPKKISELKSKTSNLNQYNAKQLHEEALKVANAGMSRIEQQVMENFDSQLANQKQNLVGQVREQSKIEILTDTLHFTREVISVSLGGLNIYQLSISKKSTSLQAHQKKKCIYILARQHAAETHGSYIMKFLIYELIHNSEKYDYLLQNYVVRLIPMVNPDGTTIGNSRCSLVGLDLNRRWAEPNPVIHPEIYFLKQSMLERSNTGPGISIFCDLHGHNKLENLFFYGCNKAADEGMLSWTKTRLLPKVFASFEHIFDYQYCRFMQDKFKLNTARVCLWSQMKVTNSFTLESSMYGFNRQSEKDQRIPPPTEGDAGQINEYKNTSQQFKEQNFSQIATNFLLAIAQYHALEKQLDKDWLKPNKLKMLGGEAAREKFNREERDNKASQQMKQIQITQSRRHGSQRNVTLPTVNTNNGLVPNKIPLLASPPESYLSQASNKDKNKTKILVRQVNDSNTDEETYQEDSDFSLQPDNLNRLKMKSTVNTKQVYWQDFYSETEKKEIMTGIIKVDPAINIEEEKESKGESDSEPSDDDYDAAEINEFFSPVLKKEPIKQKVQVKVTQKIIALQQRQDENSCSDRNNTQQTVIGSDEEQFKQRLVSFKQVNLVHESVLKKSQHQLPSQQLRPNQKEPTFQKFFIDMKGNFDKSHKPQGTRILELDPQTNFQENKYDRSNQFKYRLQSHEKVGTTHNLQDLIILSANSNNATQKQPPRHHTNTYQRVSNSGQEAKLDYNVQSPSSIQRSTFQSHLQQSHTQQVPPQIICTGIANFSINIIQGAPQTQSLLSDRKQNEQSQKNIKGKLKSQSDSKQKAGTREKPKLEDLPIVVQSYHIQQPSEPDPQISNKKIKCQAQPPFSSPKHLSELSQKQYATKVHENEEINSSIQLLHQQTQKIKHQDENRFNITTPKQKAVQPNLIQLQTGGALPLHFYQAQMNELASKTFDAQLSGRRQPNTPGSPGMQQTTVNFVDWAHDQIVSCSKQLCQKQQKIDPGKITFAQSPNVKKRMKALQKTTDKDEHSSPFKTQKVQLSPYHLDLNSPSSVVRSPQSGQTSLPQSQDGFNQKRRKNFPTPIGGGDEMFDQTFMSKAREK